AVLAALAHRDVSGIGQHIDEVLETLLGLDATALERLRDGKVI
ncbi:hypothetical protein K3Z86_22025, partial [Pseudomonas aeruginosa]|nr:hypothetical protein [Pseudomonas aeruginosa]